MKARKMLFGFIKVAFFVMVVLLVLLGTVRLCERGYHYGYHLFAENTQAVESTQGE